MRRYRGAVSGFDSRHPDTLKNRDFKGLRAIFP